MPTHTTHFPSGRALMIVLGLLGGGGILLVYFYVRRFHYLKAGYGERQLEELLMTARHEAAHFVVLHALRGSRHLGRITIYPDGQHVGLVDMDDPYARAGGAPIAIEGMATALWAGFWAEVMSGKGQYEALHCARGDIARINVLFSSYRDGYREASKDQAKLQAMLLVGEHWPAIEALAAALYARGWLSKRAALREIQDAPVATKADWSERAKAVGQSNKRDDEIRALAQLAP